MEPNLIKEVLNNKTGDFPKPEINSFSQLFVTGLASYNGDKWAKHRKIVNPAFHVEKLKVIIICFYSFILFYTCFLCLACFNSCNIYWRLI